MNKKEKKVIEAVEKLRSEILDFTCRLVAEASTLGNELSVLKVMEEELRCLKFETGQVPINLEKLKNHPGFASVPWSYDKKYNVVAIRREDVSGGRSALFNGHLDVVGIEPADPWNTESFAAVEKDGWIYGRGTGDMKAGVAAMTYAVHAVDRAGFGLKAPVTIEGVVEEECSGNGTLACLDAGYDADAVLIPEALGPTILTHQVGVMWFKVTVKGTASFLQDGSVGTNAINKCFALIVALQQLEEELNSENVPGAYQGMNQPLKLNVGIIKGGDWPSTVPAKTEFHCRLSFFPGVKYVDICRRVIRTLEEASKKDAWLAENPPETEFYGFRSEGHSISQDLPAIKTLRDCHMVFTGREAEECIATCTTDLRAFYHFGKGQATCYGPVAKNIHAPNECVNIESVLQVAKVYTLFLCRWCGLID